MHDERQGTVAKRSKNTYRDAMGRTRTTTRASFGTVRQLPSKRWQASFIGPDEQRHNAPMTFTAKIDAESWLAQQRALIVQGKWSASAPSEAHDAQAARSQTFGDYALDWTRSRISPRSGRPLAPSTRAEYERKLESVDFEPLVGLALSSITRKTVRDWYKAIAGSGRLTSAARAYQFVHGVLATAVKDGILDRNPADIEGASTASTEKPVQMPTDAELLIIEATMPDEWRAMATLSAWGGTRYGETTELRRKDVSVVDAEHVVVDVARAVTYVQGRFVVGPTKSKAGKRRVILTGQDARVVAGHLDRFVADDAEALLFPDPDHRECHLLQSKHFRVWDKVRRAAGRPDMPWHALRHHFGTKVAENGGTLADIQAALGDSTPAAALHYVDTAAERLAAIAERMSQRR